MSQFIQGIFELLAVMFDKIPALNKLKGYRSVLGFLGLGVVAFLTAKGYLVDSTLATVLHDGLLVFTGLALNAKGQNQG